MLAAPQFALAQAKDDTTPKPPRAVFGAITPCSSRSSSAAALRDVNGNQQLYDTLVNLKSGPRLLGQELSMRSTDHMGGLFDNLYLSSFGFGGDPNDIGPPADREEQVVQLRRPLPA